MYPLKSLSKLLAIDDAGLRAEGVKKELFLKTMFHYNLLTETSPL